MNKPVSQTITDEEIVRDVLAGDREKFSMLIERYQERVFHLARRIVGPQEALDLAQDTFVNAYTHLDQFNPSFRFINWILKIAQNRSLNHLRRRGLSPERLTFGSAGEETLEAVADERPLMDPAQVVESRGTAAVLEKAMARLPEKYRLLLHLRHVEGRQYQDIAEIVGVPLGTIKFRFHTLYRLLRDILVELEVVAP
jgi:RNA polymerase sigma-70 factor (ECF subfamily)